MSSALLQIHREDQEYLIQELLYEIELYEVAEDREKEVLSAVLKRVSISRDKIQELRKLNRRLKQLESGSSSLNSRRYLKKVYEMLALKYSSEQLDQIMRELVGLQSELKLNLRNHIDELKAQRDEQQQMLAKKLPGLKSVRRLFKDFSALKEHHQHTAISSNKFKAVLSIFTCWNFMLLTPLSFASNANPYPSMVSVAALLLTTPLYLISNKMAHSLISRKKLEADLISESPLEELPYRDFSDDLNHLSTWISFYKRKLADSQKWLDSHPGLLLYLEDLDLAPVSILSFFLSYLTYLVCYFTLPVSLLTSSIATISMVILWFPLSCLAFNKVRKTNQSRAVSQVSLFRQPIQYLWSVFGSSAPLATLESDYKTDPKAWSAGSDLEGPTQEILLERNLREGEEICFNIFLNSKGLSFDELHHKLNIDSGFLIQILNRMKARNYLIQELSLEKREWIYKLSTSTHLDREAGGSLQKKIEQDLGVES